MAYRGDSLGSGKAGNRKYTQVYPLRTIAQRNSVINVPDGAGLINFNTKVLDIFDGNSWRPQCGANIVYINDISDLPENNELEAGKTYDFTEVVLVTSEPIILNGTGGCNLRGGFIIYTGTGAAIRLNATSGNTRRLDQIGVQCLHPLGEVFDVSASGLGIGSAFICNNVGAASFDGVNHGAYAIGTISGVSPIFETNQYRDVDNGLIVNDAVFGSLFKTFRISFSAGATGTFLTFNGTSQGIIEMNGYFPILNTGQYGVNFNNTTNFDGVSYALGGGLFLGSATYDNLIAPGSLNQTDLGFKFVGNVGIPDSTAEIGLTLNNNLTNTTFPSVNYPVKVVATWEAGSERFLGDSTGRATYIGLEPIKILVLANPTTVTGTGTNKDISFYYCHGNETKNVITDFSDAGGGKVTVTSANHGLSNGTRVVHTNTTNYNGTYTISNVTNDTYEITETFVVTETGNWAEIIEQSRASNNILSTTKAAPTPVFELIEFVTDDYVELFIENNSDGNPMRVRSCTLTLTKI